MAKVSIIDDDRSGNIRFKEKKEITAYKSEQYAEIVFERTHGCDGQLTVDYVTLELDETDKTATADVHFEFAKGTVEFEHGESEKSIKVKLK